MGEDGFIGPYDNILATGDIHHMWLDPELPYSQLTGPFWISDMEKAEHRHDVFTVKTKPHNLSKNKLLGRLHSLGVVSKGHKADIFIKEK